MIVSVEFKKRIKMTSETKNEKFKRLAETRVQAAIKKMSLITNLADPYNYDYSKEEAHKIINAIKSELDEIRQAFERGLKKEKSEFKL